MGLAPLIVLLKRLAIRAGDEAYDESARFWTKIFGINFALGVVTGIPMESQFGTNWAQFSRLAGGVIGQPLAMEGTFSFFLESAFLGLFLYGEKRLGRWGRKANCSYLVVAENLQRAFEFVFGCWHRDLSRPFTLSGWTYEVCLNCGKKFAYDRADIGCNVPLRKQGESGACREVSHADYASISLVQR